MNAVFLWKKALRRKSVWFSLLVMFFFGLVALLAPWLSPHDPYRWDITQADRPPMWVQDVPKPGLAEFPLGTDRLGRDVLSRMIYGTRTAFLLAVLAVPLAALLGTWAGLISGYAGGRLDSAAMLLTDMIQSLPGIMVMVIVVLIFRSLWEPTWFHGVLTLVVGFAAVSWVSLMRLVRVTVLMLKSQLFIEAAASLGASPWYILRRHLLPNVQHVIWVWVINNIPAAILLEAVLGYVGIGITSVVADNDSAMISWGGMFFSGRAAINRNPFMLIVPSLGILLISMSFILLADFLKGISRQE